MPNSPLRFGYIAEGATDHAVLDSLLAGFFDNPDIEGRPFSPLTDATAKGTPASFGGWSNVLDYIASQRFVEAFQYVDFVIVQIDTDICHEKKFGVSISSEDSIPVIVEKVVANLKARIAPSVWEQVGNQTIFAIPVDSIECWLLVLYQRDNDPTRSRNCLHHLNEALQRNRIRPISDAAKQAKYYATISAGFAKPKTLTKVAAKSESLKIFLDSLASAMPVEETTAEASFSAIEDTPTP